MWYISHSNYSSARKERFQVDWSPVLTSISQEYFEHFKANIERSHDGGYQKQDDLQEIQCKYYFICKKVINESIMFYFKAKIYSSEVLSPQEANRNMPEGNKYQYGNDKK